MAILVTNDTRLCVSGITGREGTFHTLNNRNYGTNVVSGVTPGKGGQDVEGIPVFNTFHDAVGETGANTAMIFVPPRFAADSILEAEDAGISLSSASPRASPPTTSCASTTTWRATRTSAWSARTAPASCRRARPTSASSPRRSSARATSASCRAPAR